MQVYKFEIVSGGGYFPPTYQSGEIIEVDISGVTLKHIRDAYLKRLRKEHWEENKVFFYAGVGYESAKTSFVPINPRSGHCPIGMLAIAAHEDGMIYFAPKGHEVYTWLDGLDPSLKDGRTVSGYIDSLVELQRK